MRQVLIAGELQDAGASPACSFVLHVRPLLPRLRCLGWGGWDTGIFIGELSEETLDAIDYRTKHGLVAASLFYFRERRHELSKLSALPSAKSA
jgi:hypothetical protein